MAERKYYVLCEDNCKFEGMTKEQIYTAITEITASGQIKDVDSGFVTKLKEQNGGQGLQMWIGTQAEYNAIKEKTNNCFYIITDDTTEEDIAATLEEQNENIAAMQEQLEKELTTNDISDNIVIASALSQTLGATLKYKKLLIRRDVVELDICFNMPNSVDDTTQTIATIKKGYAPTCNISASVSGYGSTFNNTAGLATASIIRNSDGTADVNFCSIFEPKGTFIIHAVWLI